MTKSMTGFASASGAADGYSWTWDIRSVNARGMDARLRIPDWIDGLEATLRPEIKKTVARGNVNVTLKVSTEENGQGIQVDSDALAQILPAIQQIEDAASNEHGLKLAATSAADILAMRSLAGAPKSNRDLSGLTKILTSDFEKLLEGLNQMRSAEGAELKKVLTSQLGKIENLTNDAKKAAQSRSKTAADQLRDNLARILENSDGADPDRVAQELALISLKSDVTEEIDRLHAHVAAARDLLAVVGPIGRKLDFLTQEFNREANTLCSKAQSKMLTRIGLDLKAVIDQMREQVQNVE